MLKKRLGVEGVERDWGSVSVKFSFLIDYYKIPSSLIIPEGCWKIGRYAFYRCERLREVVVPENVEIIEGCAFCRCNSATIILKKSWSEFKSIKLGAFKDCKDVKEEVRS